MTKNKSNKLKNASIQWKIFGFLCLFCGALILVMWFLQTVFLNDFYRLTKTQTAKETANYLANNLNSENINELVDQLAQNNEVSIVVVDLNGSSLVTSHGGFSSGILNRLPTAEKLVLLQNALNQGGTYLTEFSSENENIFDPEDGYIGIMPGNRLKNGSIIYTKLVTDGQGNTQYAIFIDAPIQPVEDVISTLKSQLWFVTGVMVILSILVAVLLAKYIARPIQRLNEKAKQLETGDFDIHFDASGYREIDELNTTLNHSAEELGKVESLRRELIANTSHDLRTPLTLISGYAEMMRDLPGENKPENAQVIVDETARLSTLVEDMLDFSKYQAGSLTLAYSSFDLIPVLQGTVDNLRALLKNEAIQIETDFPSALILEADQSKISQVFYNLLINAVNYTGADKRVQVKVESLHDSVRVSFTDSGEGIGEKDLPYIWDRYYKVDKTHQRPVTGSGIGLSIVKSIVTLHQGQVGVESKVGEGSTFWFSIPLKAPTSNSKREA